MFNLLIGFREEVLKLTTLYSLPYLLTYTYLVFVSTCSPDVALNWAGFRSLTRFAGEHMRQRKFALIQRHSADFHVTGR